MSGTEFAPLVAILLTFAPPDWTAMRVTYRYDEPQKMADTNTYAMTEKSSPEWFRVSHSGFKMMDFFDAYRDRTRPQLKKRWSTVTVTVTRDNPEPTIEFGYEVLDLTDRRL